MTRYLIARLIVVTAVVAVFIARGGRSTTLEGPPARGRVVFVEFPSFERAQEFYTSAEYEAARKVRPGAATAQFVLVEGI